MLARSCQFQGMSPYRKGLSNVADAWEDSSCIITAMLPDSLTFQVACCGGARRVMLTLTHGQNGMAARLSEATGDAIPRGCCRNQYLRVQGPWGGSPGFRLGRLGRDPRWGLASQRDADLSRIRFGDWDGGRPLLARLHCGGVGTTAHACLRVSRSCRAGSGHSVMRLHQIQAEWSRAQRALQAHPTYSNTA